MISRNKIPANFNVSTANSPEVCQGLNYDLGATQSIDLEVVTWQKIQTERALPPNKWSHVPRPECIKVYGGRIPLKSSWLAPPRPYM